MGKPAFFLFAWFTATGGYSASGSKAETAAIVSATKTAGIPFDVTITVAPYRTNAGVVGTGEGKVAITEGMNLCTWDDGQVKFGYVAAGSERLQTARIGSLDYWRIYKVTIAFTHDAGQSYQTVDGQQYTDEQMYSALSGKNYKLDVDRDASNSNVSKAKFFAATNETDAMAAGADTLALQAAEAINSTNFADEWYFGVYIDGHEHTTDNTTQNGNFVVTLTQTN